MLCIFIDALNPEYLEHMTFLKSLKKSCLHGYLEVPIGYTGIIASFMTGVWPDKHKIFDLFVPDEKRKRKIKNKHLLGIIRLIQNKKLFFTPPKTKLMYFFKPSLNKNWAQRNCLNHPTLFDFVEKKKKSFESIDWPNHFKNRNGKIFFSQNWKTVLKKTKKSKADFIFTHFLDLEAAHEYGVKSKETILAAKKIDNAVKELWDKDEDILIFSDHGMDDVKEEINILPEIRKLNLKFGEDFIFIVGSTSIEFWFKNKKAEEKVIEVLEKLDCGEIIDLKKYKIKTGSLIFMANFKTAFYPNFFSNKHFKAMHGWDPKIQKTYYIFKNKEKKGKKDAYIVDFFPTILKIMDLDKAKSDGKSLV